MHLQSANTVVAICQLRMHWTIEENMASVLDAIDLAHSRGARICAFPELAITGFHRQIVALAKPELIAPEINRLRAICARKSIAIAVGAPTFADDGVKFNSHLLIDEFGKMVSTISKAGLTAPEATFFHPGAHRPIGELVGLRCTAVICREVEDHDHVCAQLPHGAVDLILWPGHMRPDPAKPVYDPPEHVVEAQQLARTIGAYVVQANWPNALNRPEESEHAGRSAVIAADGELLFRLPEQAPGVGVFALGARTFEWHPSEA